MEDTIISNYAEIKNPTWELGKKSICVIVRVAGSKVEMPYTAAPWGKDYNDPVSTEIYEMALAGKFGEILPVPQSAIDMQNLVKMEKLKEKLDELTREANDICQPLSEEKELGIISDEDLEKYKKWAIYRQKLRKLDLNSENIDWPEKPE